MLENGTANRDDIDTAMKRGCNFPLGPLALLDLVGLDTALSILDALYAELRAPNYAPITLLRRLVAPGQPGRKCCAGFDDSTTNVHTRTAHPAPPTTRPGSQNP